MQYNNSNVDNLPIYTVDQLSSSIKQLLSNSYQNIKVKGEVTGIFYKSGKNLYFSLKNKNVLLKTVIFHNNIEQNLTFIPKEGMNVICQGSISNYATKSEYQLFVNNITLDGEGEFLKILNERKKKLIQQGIFDKKHKKILPKIPNNIAIITSKEGAVLYDILNRLQLKTPCSIFLYNVCVQGAEAVEQISEAIKNINKHTNSILLPNIDIIIVARGGGSIEDLWCFNEEKIIFSVFASKIPVISAVGHETDYTLIDYVSDIRAPTPTASIEYIGETKKYMIHNINQYYSQIAHIILHNNILPHKNSFLLTKLQQKNYILNTYLKNPIKYKIHKIADCDKKLHDEVKQKITYYHKWLQKDSYIQVNNNTIKLKYLNLNKDTKYINIQVKRYLNQKINKQLITKELSEKIIHNQIDKLMNKIENNFNYIINNIINKLSNYQKHIKHKLELLEANHYINVLKKGYAILFDENNLSITTKQQFNKANKVWIQFIDGKIQVK